MNLPEWCFRETNHPFTKERLNVINQIKDTMIDRIRGKERLFPFMKEEQAKEIEPDEDKEPDIGFPEFPR